MASSKDSLKRPLKPVFCLSSLRMEGQTIRLSELPIGQEIAQASQLLSEISTTDCIVMDTENKRTIIKADLAVSLAAHLSARYYTIEDLKADYLVEMVKAEKD